MAADNRFLGSANLLGISPAPRGMAQIEVVFDIDHNGILTATAKDLSSQREVKSTFDSPSRLSEEEVASSKRFMAQMISRISVQLSCEEEKQRLENLKSRVASWEQEIQKLIEAHKENLTDNQVSILQAGLRLLGDFSERGTAQEELERIYGNLKDQIEIFRASK